MSRDCGRLLKVKHWLFGLVVLCSGLASGSVGAQAVTGTVVTIDSITPIGGAIVVATPSSGVSAGTAVRALASPDGRFFVRLPAGGEWRLTVLRIGFAPSMPTTVRVEGQATVRVKLVAHSAAVSLQVMNTRGSTDCRVRPDTGLLVARAWEEARKAMLSVTLQSQDTTVIGEWLEYRRTSDAGGRLIVDQEVRTRHHVTQRVFRSPSGDVLARDGYVTTDSTGVTFYAPDPDALLSDAFSASHCFRLARPSSADDSTIGVSFQPTRNVRGFHDIEGTVWMDAKTSQLRSVDFAYTNLPATRQTITSGGQVVFARLNTGQWIVRSWYAQLPILVAPPRLNAPGTSGSRSGVIVPVVKSVHTTGGEAFRISRDNATLAVRPMPYARIQLASHDPRVPLAGAQLTLRGTNIRAVSDASGAIVAGPLPSGRYEFGVQFPKLDSITAPRVSGALEVRSGTAVDTVTVPRISVLLRDVCADRPSSTAGTAVLRGTVRDSSGQVVSNATVHVKFMRVDARQLKTKNVKWNEETVQARTDEQGEWLMCGIPHEADIALDVRHDVQTVQRRFRVSDARLFLNVDVVLTNPSRFE